MIYVSFLLAMAVVIVTSAMLYYFVRTQENAFMRQVEQGATGMNTVLEDYKAQALYHAGFFSQYPGVAQAMEQKDGAALVRLLGPLAKEAKIDSVTISDDKGVVIARTHDPKTGDSVMNQMNVQMALKGTTFAAVEAGTVVKLSVRAGAPVRNQEGKIVGVVTPGYNASRDEIVDRVKQLFGVEATMFLGDERVATTIVRDGKRVIGTKVSESVADKVLKQGQNYAGRADILGQEYFTAYIPLLGADKKPLGIIFTGQSTAELTMEKNKMITMVSVIAVCVIAIGIFLTFLLAGRISGPITLLAGVAGKVAAGDLTQQVQVASGDEIGLLSGSFNSMVEQLRSLLTVVTNLTRTLADSSGELAEGAVQASSAASHAASAINDVVKGAELQRKSVAETTPEVGKMSAGIEKMADGVELAAAMADKAVKASDGGGKAIETAISQMARIETSVSGSARVVAKLGQQSQQIGQIVDTISGIAGQTNLLALNAAIEAARAGEQGRGFAVVAEEVRKLAEQSGEAAHQISALISEIQSDTQQAVTAMEQGAGEVSTGIRVVSDAGEAFRLIADLVRQVSGQVGIVAGAIGQITAGNEKMVAAMNQIEEVSTQTFDQTRRVLAATDQQSATMEGIIHSSRSLARLAEELQTAIARFKA